jgi:predicted metal-dependent hydrolase
MGPRSSQIVFLDQSIQVVRKLGARRLSISIRPDRPLRVTSNLSTSDSEIVQFLQNHTTWIEKNLAKLKKYNEAHQKPEFKEGSVFPFLGEFKYFQFSETTLKNIFFKIEDGFLICYLPKQLQSAQLTNEILENQLQKFYQEKAEIYLAERMLYFQKLTSLKPQNLQFRRAQTRWGSCNSKKKIVLNWKLICYSTKLIDYVIVHELCHLVHLNHSARFWQLVATYMPEYKTYEKTLSEQAPLCTFLNKNDS